MSPTEYNFKKECPLFDPSKYAGITQDSRAVKPNFIFAALSGENHDGAHFIPNAIENGATLIICETGRAKESNGVDIIETPNPRQTFAHMTAAYFNHSQPENIVAITGTNGKSSVVDFVNQLWKALGYKSSTIGTLSHAHTTPDPLNLHAALNDLRKSGVTHMAMEASSHGIDQYRLDGATIKVAAITNITQDHLDYHKTMDAYRAAKAQLFSRVLNKSGTAVLNADIAEFKAIKAECDARNIKTLSYGKSGADLQILSTHIIGQGQQVTFKVSGEDHTQIIPLVGAFQIENLMCALACVIAEKTDKNLNIKNLVQTLSTIKPVRGRLEHVQSKDNQYNGYVDYAHTPDALQTVLKALRPHTSGRLICIFGCGGDRDKDKRPQMGKIAAKHADVSVITDDNPRTESPKDIRRQIKSGCTQAHNVIEITERDIAIHRAVATMTKEDVLLVAGKGHEQGQIFKDKTIPFDDVTHLNNAFSNPKSHQPLSLTSA